MLGMVLGMHVDEFECHLFSWKAQYILPHIYQLKNTLLFYLIF
jgi:hypothetical protein